MNRKKVLDSIVGLVALLAVTAFLIIGFIGNGWPYAWLVFLAIPVTAVIVDLIQKKKKIAGQIPGLVAILATAIYLILGFGFGLWHPGWIVFLAIPISGIIAGMFTDEPAAGQPGQSGPTDNQTEKKDDSEMK